MAKPWIRIDLSEVSATEMIAVGYTRKAGVTLGEYGSFTSIVLKTLYPNLNDSDLVIAENPDSKFSGDASLTIFIGYYYLNEDDEIRLGISVSKLRKDQFCEDYTMRLFKRDADQKQWRALGDYAINLTKVLQEISKRMAWERAVLGSDKPRERMKKLHIPCQTENINEHTFMLSVPVCGVSTEHYEQHYLKARTKTPKTT